MIKFTKKKQKGETKPFSHPLVKDFQKKSGQLIRELESDILFFINSEYYVNHFLEARIVEVSRFFKTNQVGSPDAPHPHR